MSSLQQNQSQGQNGTCLKLRRGGERGEAGWRNGPMYEHNKKFKKILKIKNKCCVMSII
jgi:hypothetical protein